MGVLDCDARVIASLSRGNRIQTGAAITGPATFTGVSQQVVGGLPHLGDRGADTLPLGRSPEVENLSLRPS